MIESQTLQEFIYSTETKEWDLRSLFRFKLLLILSHQSNRHWDKTRGAIQGVVSFESHLNSSEKNLCRDSNLRLPFMIRNIFWNEIEKRTKQITLGLIVPLLESFSQMVQLHLFWHYWNYVKFNLRMTIFCTWLCTQCVRIYRNRTL